MKKQPKPPGNDAKAIARALCAIVQGGERGTLTATAQALGMTASAARKRLMRPGAGLDEATIKAVLFIADRKAENYADWNVTGSNTIGRYVIETRQREQQTVTTWRLEPVKELKTEVDTENGKS